jgi:hypothetical protein
LGWENALVEIAEKNATHDNTVEIEVELFINPHILTHKKNTPF